MILAALGAVAFAFLLVDHLRLWPAAKRERASPVRRHWPSLSILRPIRGPDPECAENTRALLEQDYPGRHEILFVFDSVADPSLPVVSEVLRTHPLGWKATVRIAGPPPPSRTGKLNAMICGLSCAKGDLVAVTDSDLRLQKDALRLLVDALLERPEAGAAFAPVATAAPPKTAGEAAYGLLVNAWYGPAAARAAQPTGTLPWIMGEVMVLRREALAAVGGFEALEGQLVDDMYLGACFQKAGFENVSVPWSVPIVTEPIGARRFLTLFRRWVAFSRSGLPASFRAESYLRGAAALGALAAFGASVATGQPLGAVVAGAAVALWTGSQLALSRRFSGHAMPLRYAWLPALLPAIGALVALSLRLRPSIDWRGRRYALDRKARLASRRRAPAVQAPRLPKPRSNRPASGLPH